MSARHPTALLSRCWPSRPKAIPTQKSPLSHGPQPTASGWEMSPLGPSSERGNERSSATSATRASKPTSAVLWTGQMDCQPLLLWVWEEGEMKPWASLAWFCPFLWLHPTHILRKSTISTKYETGARLLLFMLLLHPRTPSVKRSEYYPGRDTTQPKSIFNPWKRHLPHLWTPGRRSLTWTGLGVSPPWPAAGHGHLRQENRTVQSQ